MEIIDKLVYISLTKERIDDIMQKLEYVTKGGRVTMVRILEQTSFGWMIKDTEIGKITFICINGEEQIIKFMKGEEIPFDADVMKDAVVFLANGEEYDGIAGRVESLDLVRYILENEEPRTDTFTARNCTVIAVPEILRIYRDIIENRISKIGDNRFWKLMNDTFTPVAKFVKKVSVHDLPPLRYALINGLNTNF
ncbi:MAG: hypothetical protein IKK43_01260 [Clostridia bacterium]|nr:hypothetical protein [Clostridia bacterium]